MATCDFRLSTRRKAVEAGSVGVEQQIRDAFSDFIVKSVAFEGEGDFCRAYNVNDAWIFRFAYNAEGSRSLEREAALLPRLAEATTLAIPNIAYFGRDNESGLAFAGHIRVPGEQLTAERLQAMEPGEQEQCAHDLAGFLRAVHTFSVETALEAGVVRCDYPFCRAENGIDEGNAEEFYSRELERLQSYPQLDNTTKRYVRTLVEGLREGGDSLDETLVHGDLTQEHVLFNAETKRITGVIDFSDVVITTPTLDLVYLYHAYGKEFFERLLSLYCRDLNIDQEQVSTEVELLHGWYTALRLLWALDHDYRPGIDARLKELQAVRDRASQGGAGHAER
jgi:aminoglycoside phosphotransferase (APT) family kinase protein